MYKTCWHCEKNYIEEEEEICIDCSLFFTEENEYFSELENERIIEEYGDNDFLNDLGVSYSVSNR